MKLFCNNSEGLFIYNTAVAVAAWITTYTGLPIEPVFLLVTIMAMDFFTGIGKAHTLLIPITSKRMKAGVISKLSLLMLPLGVALAARAMGADWSWLLTYTINLVILSELYSLISNIYTIKKRKELPEFDAISILAGRIRDVAEKLTK